MRLKMRLEQVVNLVVSPVKEQVENPVTVPMVAKVVRAENLVNPESLEQEIATETTVVGEKVPQRNLTTWESVLKQREMP